MATREERSRSFGTVASDYDRLRPAPAPEAVDWLLPEGCQVAVDLGAGTGLLSRALALRVRRVVAVEPDPRMAAVLRARSPGVHVTGGRGEAIPLRDGSADGVFVSSAWHWMNPDAAAAEVWRVLRDGGRFGMIWTGIARDQAWPDGAPWIRPGRADAAPGRRRREITLPAGMFEHMSTAAFSYRRAMTPDDIVAMLGTYSGVITASPQERQDRLDSARAELQRRFPAAQTIDAPIQSRCWRADRAAPGRPGAQGRS